ncbi:MAG: ferredoxin--nitrite reductase [Cyclobacteriaceae bacterium]|nr:MAG: ferredoxin--nitrite reductase [Cyclobacteriaceae bacterium]
MTISTTKSITKQAQKDVLELERKINDFRSGKIPEDRFKAFRLTRGVYGQRQLGVQMVRIKIPFGRLTTRQLVRIADISEKYTNGNLHATTRQNIQLHYVKVDDSPSLWADLEDVGLTLREACGNTVRNITGSAYAGIDPNEPFDISPYAQGMFEYFLRNPVCQDMGRKIKSAFSSSEQDSAYTYFHDFGFIPRIKDGEKGFKVVVGGGLGAQSLIAHTVYEFLPADRIIPFKEAALRVFDRYGEREKRMKARMKFLLDSKRGIGLEKFLELTEEEMKGLAVQTFEIDTDTIPQASPTDYIAEGEAVIDNHEEYQLWLKTNVFEQKQQGYFAVNIKPELGNIKAPEARILAELVDKYAADDIRVTVNQGFVLRYVRPENISHLYVALKKIRLAASGFDTIADITACPGTDTCNLGVTNSTGVAQQLESLIRKEYPHLITESDINIKISGCMNSCGQHMAASIGFHGSSIKHGPLVIPALQVVLGGGVDVQGRGFVAEKIIKLPTKRIPQALRLLLDDYQDGASGGSYFNDYVNSKGKHYFYDLLKPLADLTSVKDFEYVDWGHSENFIPEIGVGECAGVSYDMVGTIIGDSQEKLEFAEEAYNQCLWKESIYNAYTSLVVAAKALLLSEDIRCNTHIGILKDFDLHFIQQGKFTVAENFESYVLEINQQAPNQEFALEYLQRAQTFLEKVMAYRGVELEESEKVVVNNYYKA